jgi:dipeptidyl aminopeptidase/acylaminoacyl peptidase
MEDGKVYPPGMGHFLGKRFFESLPAVNPLEYAKSYGGTVLIVHAKDDATLSPKHSLSYFQSFHGHAVLPRMLLLNEGGHTFTTEFSEKTVIEETAGFLSGALL